MAEVSDDGFTFVSRKKAASKIQRKQRDVRIQGIINDENLSDEKVTDSLEKCRNEVICSSFFHTFESKLVATGVIHNTEVKDVSSLEGCQVPKRIVCYGVGNYASCLIARYQLALLQVLRHRLGISKENCEVYDPRFSQQEITLLPQLDLTAIPVNEEGKRPVDERTLFYMPHCGRPLYNNLLWANWTPLSLQHLTLIGNSFSFIHERTPDKILHQDSAFILQILPYVDEHKLDQEFKHNDVFNNMSLHVFPHSRVDMAPATLWTPSSPPVYKDDVEIILHSACGS